MYQIRLFYVHLPGFEPRITVPKTVVISISPQVQNANASIRCPAMKINTDTLLYLL